LLPSVDLQRQGRTLSLLPQRAVWLPDDLTLVVADLHVGKAHAFRRQGVPVPGGTTAQTLDRLGDLVDQTGAHRVVVAGDLLHARQVQGSPALAALLRWRGQRPALEIVLVRGNHDDHAGDPPPALRIETVTGPWRCGVWAVVHDADDAVCADAGDAAMLISGHLHPGIALAGRAGTALTLPCFVVGKRHCTVPAFGAFTGLHRVRPVADERIWAIVDDKLVSIPNPCSQPPG
jgi:DNA ligase-associated metallophosphoesterase